jgi:phage tail sheath protein FI
MLRSVVSPTTMTQDDINNGRAIVLIGFAPLKPAEFVIFRIQQKTASPEK